MFWTRIAILLAAPLLLTSCFLLPGRFTAEMVIGPEGAFTYSYRGEIVLLGHDGIDQSFGIVPAHPAPEEETESQCYKETTGQPRPCTPEELAERERAEREFGVQDEIQQQQMREAFRVFFGQVEPGSDESLRALAERLQGQNGWRSVSYRGNGVFDVDYQISGTLDRDFVFPVAPDFAFTVPMLTAVPRTDGTVLVQAPAFASPSPALGGDSEEEDMADEMPRGEGVFTLRTQGNVIETNAPGGTQPEGADNVLSWTIGENQTERPMARISLAPAP